MSSKEVCSSQVSRETAANTLVPTLGDPSREWKVYFGSQLQFMVLEP